MTTSPIAITAVTYSRNHHRGVPRPVQWGVMSGKSNKARRKQERLRQRRSGQRPPGEPGKREVCPLYRNPPEGAFYKSWVDCGSLEKPP